MDKENHYKCPEEVEEIFAETRKNIKQARDIINKKTLKSHFYIDKDGKRQVAFL